ncbi:disease resistance protein RPV1-like [Rutidosis leptorrhynchoides]|uniref:disease resistance protein RPV1-like n=1 Tax=Rutidosis leptorrhynchoides TaxID=125765 RepID=UPI003A99E703
MEQYEMSSSTRDVLPVFYNVDPTHVRNQTGSFEEAFKGYDVIIDKETDIRKKKELSKHVKAWRGSLHKAGSLTGMVLGDGYESQFITNMIQVIRKKLNYNDLYIKGKLVGIKEIVGEIELWLQDTSPDSTTLLIHGMGGIGKTTLAKCIFNSNYREYDASCFLAKISEGLNEEKALLRFQTQLLSKILKSENEEKIWDVDDGITKVIKAICSKRILLVLDDVQTSRQLDALLGKRMFHPGSKVIITTRNQSLLNEFEVRPRVQTLQTLTTQDSSQLFRLYAFRPNQPIQPYIRQSELAINHCMGLPLALIVLGSYLRDLTIMEWEDVIHRLASSIPLNGIHKVLQLSYETLEDDSHKDLFLHIACFFVLEDKDFIVKLFAGCNLQPTVGIRKLMDRCLINVEYGKVGMHPLIREMGREVVRRESLKYPGKRTRLWCHEDFMHVLQENEGTETVEGIVLDMQKMEHGNEEIFNIGALEKMKNLMLLQLNYATISGSCNNLPTKLRLLRWHGFPLTSIPGYIPMKKLVILDMSYSKLKRVWDDFKSIESLKILNLSYCEDLMKTPNFSGLSGLEKLILKGCKRLRKVDKSLESLNKLALLDITDCIKLREFPLLPASLVSLEMSSIPNLADFRSLQCSDSTPFDPKTLVNSNVSMDWSNLVSLERLIIDGNNIITRLPQVIQTLPKLLYLQARHISTIKSIKGLPDKLNPWSTSTSKSLEKVQHSEIRGTSSMIYEYTILKEVEGYYKWSSIDKVEKKIIQKMGLGSSMDLGSLDYSKLKVLYDSGIFSTWVRGNLIPCCSSYMYYKKGPEISFRVPENDSRRITSFNLCLVVLLQLELNRDLKIQVYNMFKDLLLEYRFQILDQIGKTEKIGWVSHWRCGNLLDHGDQIFVRVLLAHYNVLYMDVEECGINLIYQDDTESTIERDDEDGDKVGMNAIDGIAWSDRMNTEISDCVHNGMTYSFGSFWPLEFGTNVKIQYHTSMCKKPSKGIKYVARTGSVQGKVSNIGLNKDVFAPGIIFGSLEVEDDFEVWPGTPVCCNSKEASLSSNVLSNVRDDKSGSFVMGNKYTVSFKHVDSVSSEVVNGQELHKSYEAKILVNLVW